MVPYMWVVEWPGMRSECTSSELLATHLAEKWAEDFGPGVTTTITPLYTLEQCEERERKARREALEEAANTCRGLLPTTAQLDEMERHGMSFSGATRMCHDAIRELMDTRRDGE